MEEHNKLRTMQAAVRMLLIALVLTVLALLYLLYYYFPSDTLDSVVNLVLFLLFWDGLVIISACQIYVRYVRSPNN
jgi:hypothetical protein